MIAEVTSYVGGVLHRSAEESWIPSPTKQAVPLDEHHH